MFVVLRLSAVSVGNAISGNHENVRKCANDQRYLADLREAGRILVGADSASQTSARVNREARRRTKMGWHGEG
jgi:hypothetical protein